MKVATETWFDVATWLIAALLFANAGMRLLALAFVGLAGLAVWKGHAQWKRDRLRRVTKRLLK